MNTRQRQILTLGIVLSVLTTVWAQQTQPAATPTFSPDAYLSHIRYLASDELTGRFPDTPGGRKAAEYIAAQFAAAGCEPAGEDHTWFQHFEVAFGKRLVAEKATLEISGVDREWKVRQDWIPFPFTVMEDVEGPLAFAGYGIQAAEHDYDDYGDFDAAGKVLLILRYEPKAEDPQATFGGATLSNYATFYRKIHTATKHEALAVLIVNPPNREPDRDKLYEFTAFRSQETFDLPMAHISRALANAILKKAGQPDLRTLQERLDRDRQPLAQDLGLTVKLHPGVEPNALAARNVLGLIPGDGSTAETIVVGAHYDHLGVRPPNRGDDYTPVIHNGADDNASGTAGVIELARAIKRGPTLRRNVLFMGFDAEELGLCGSRHFVEHPTLPLESIAAMLNLDMIGRLAQGRFTVFGTSTAPELPELVAEAAAPFELEYQEPLGVSGASDHASFIRRQIPAIFLITGVHQQYHQPDDDWELIDAPGATRVLQMAHGLLIALANLETGPTFTEPTSELEPEYDVKRPAAEEEQAEGGAAATQSAADADRAPSRADMRVRLGVIPDHTATEPGMTVLTVLDGGAARAAGMQDGDRITKIGNEDIRDIYAYMRVLAELKPGNEVDVLVIRQSQEHKLTVKLQASRRPPGDD